MLVGIFRRRNLEWSFIIRTCFWCYCWFQVRILTWNSHFHHSHPWWLFFVVKFNTSGVNENPSCYVLLWSIFLDWIISSKKTHSKSGCVEVRRTILNIWNIILFKKMKYNNIKQKISHQKLEMENKRESTSKEGMSIWDLLVHTIRYPIKILNWKLHVNPEDRSRPTFAPCRLLQSLWVHMNVTQLTGESSSPGVFHPF